MAVHDEVLAAALRICRRRGGWRFRPIEIVRALPHLDDGTVRTHITSRCCFNAPRNHPHKWDYFDRVARGLYEIRRTYRRRRPPRKTRSAAREPRTAYRSESTPLLEVVHAVASQTGGNFVAECLEIAVVTQGRTLDELIANLQEAVGLHLEGEDPNFLGLVAAPRLTITYETDALPS